MKKITLTKAYGRSKQFKATIAADQPDYELAIWSGARPYLWVGPNMNTSGHVTTINLGDLKRLLRKAGHLD